MIEEDEEYYDNTILIEDVTEEESNTIHFQLSSLIISSYSSPKALKFLGFVLGLSITILVDTGNSHNIIQSPIVNHLKLATAPTTPFLIMVGNGDRVDRKLVCHTITIHENFLHLLFTFCPLKELILSWEIHSWNISIHFATPYLSFSYHNQIITLSSNSPKFHQSFSYT